MSTLVFDEDSRQDESDMRQGDSSNSILSLNSPVDCYCAIFTFFSGTDQQNYLEAAARLFRGITSRPSPARRR